MRHFSNIEKASINQIVNYSGSDSTFVLANAYMDIFYQKKVEYRNDSLFFYRSADLKDIETTELLSIHSRILEISLLISFLERERYIYLIDDNIQQNNVSALQNIFDKKGLVAIEVPMSNEIANIINRSINHRIFVSEDLKALVADNFESIEDKTLKQAKCQSILASITTVAAILSLIISACN